MAKAGLQSARRFTPQWVSDKWEEMLKSIK